MQIQGYLFLSKRSFHYYACKLGLVDMILVESFFFSLPLKMNGMHKTQFDHIRFDLAPLVLLSCVFYILSETYAKHNVGAKAV